MDPITAISLASNVISFIDFGTKVLSGARKVQEAGALEDNETLESVVRQMQTFIAKLLAPDQTNLTGTDWAWPSWLPSAEMWLTICCGCSRRSRRKIPHRKDRPSGP
ncbi:hypothetical protein LZ30DRAFT_322205 [Colletotrichum cereale]|nr:hypothetical protein LZ30DRAFT_322205 [Colletotrichum cereale]